MIDIMTVEAGGVLNFHFGIGVRLEGPQIGLERQIW